VVEAVDGGHLTFRGLEVRVTFTAPIGHFYEATEQDRQRARDLIAQERI